MTPTARVYRHPRSPFFQAWFLAWDADRREWRATTKSTKCTDEAEALGMARELERIALEASGQMGAVRIGQDWAQTAVNSLLRRAGVREIITGKSWESYSAEWLAMRAKKIKASTLVAYKAKINVFNAYLGKDKTLPMAAFTPAIVQKWYDTMLEEGRSTTTVGNSVHMLSLIFDRAREEGLCSRNPFALIEKAKTKVHERDAYTAGQIVQILSYLRADPDREDWLTVVLLGLCTGQRLNDCARVHWTHLDVTGSTWVWNLTQQKTAKPLRVPIVEPLAGHLRAMKGKAQDLALAPRLAHFPIATSSILLSTEFRGILQSAGVVGRKVTKKGAKGRNWNSLTFHSFRHTCNSLLANAGVSGDVRMSILGHASQKMNNRYTHLEDEIKGTALVEAITKAVS